MHVEEHTITLGDSPVFYRTAGPDTGQPGGGTTRADDGAEIAGGRPTAPSTPIVYVHGVPTSSDDWLPFLERTGGIAPDLIGFGRTGKGAHLSYTPESLADFLGKFLAELDVQQFTLVLHGWGAAAGVLLAAQDPDRIDRLVLISPVPILENVRWPWWARAWRTRMVGEMIMGFTSRIVLTRGLRSGSATPVAWPAQRLAQVWEQFDQGTQRAILRLARSIDDEEVRTFAEALRSVDVPGLVMWGERDPWWGPEVADAYAALLPLAKVARIPDAGHWPWLDDPSVVDRVAAFV